MCSFSAMQEIDPELSASTGLTNDVCGRLSIFTALPSPSKDLASNSDEAAGICSALPTPSKVRNHLLRTNNLFNISSIAIDLIFYGAVWRCER